MRLKILFLNKMKTKNKSSLIIIRGPLGVGKSTISKLLAQEIDAEYYSIDKILEENGLDRGDNAFTPEDFIKANKIILKEVKKHLNKKTVIIDGNFYFKEAIEHLEKEIKNTMVFTLKAKLETCIKRDKARKISYGEQAAKEVHALTSKVNHGIDIDAENKTKDQIIEELKSIIKRLCLKS